MAVAGKELATLDFGNLIGGPLNAIIEAQAKSALTTAKFIKEVAFDKDGNVINVDFKYNRKDDQDRDQEFTLTVPFLTMLPIPYISVSNALVEFNAKITSITSDVRSDVIGNNTQLSAGGNSWFASAKMSSKTAYQRASGNSDREERTFDMHVSVQARNQDMPAGTERLLTILENSIFEKSNGHVHFVKLKKIQANNKTEFHVDSTDGGFLKKLNGLTFSIKPSGNGTSSTYKLSYVEPTLQEGSQAAAPGHVVVMSENKVVDSLDIDVAAQTIRVPYTVAQ